jgi:hypothetical protein
MTIVQFLDTDWQPLRVEPWTRAITDLFNGKIEVIEYSRDRTIRGVGRDVRAVQQPQGEPTPRQASMTLLRKPAKPRYLPTVTVKMDARHVPEEWRPYWNVTLDR